MIGTTCWPGVGVRSGDTRHHSMTCWRSDGQITAMLVHNPARYFTGGQE